MAGEVEVLNGGGPLKTTDSGLAWNLGPSISRSPAVMSPSLNGFGGCLYADNDPLLQIRDEGGCFCNETLAKLIPDLFSPVRTEIVGNFITEAEGTFALGRMGRIHL